MQYLADSFKEQVKRILTYNDYSDLEHEGIKISLKQLLEKEGYLVRIGFPIKASQPEVIDLVAIHELAGYIIGVEIDNASPRKKSLDKLIRLKPHIGIILLRSKIPHHKKTLKTVQNIHIPLIILNISTRNILFQSAILL